MTSEELAKLYAEVVKVRPEAAVDGMTWDQDEEIWRYGYAKFAAWEAGALFLRHWLSMLPPNTAPVPRGDGMWRIIVLSENMGDLGWAALYRSLADSPLESLASYLKSTGTEDKA